MQQALQHIHYTTVKTLAANAQNVLSAAAAPEIPVPTGQALREASEKAAPTSKSLMLLS